MSASVVDDAWSFVSGESASVLIGGLYRSRLDGVRRCIGRARMTGMGDPLEGVAADGTIVTGADAARIPREYDEILRAAVAEVSASGSDVALYLYGSVANGTAQPPESDVDLISVGLPGADAEAMSSRLAERFSAICRSVDVGPATMGDTIGDHDEAVGNRAFLRHYCVHLAGPDPAASLPDAMAGADVARGFNGDIEHHALRWRDELMNGHDAAVLGRRIGRKTLLAVAGLVSVRESTWTTDRAVAAERYAALEPDLACGMDRLLRWSDEQERATAADVREALDNEAADVIADFADTIGVWPDPAGVRRRFVIHEHYATSHHFDLRLERIGVLRSWAVPRNMPVHPKGNRLAVAVEDHDLDHIDFEDPTLVPDRDDGAVRKSIWDAGTYTIVREQPDKFVVDITGRRLDGRYALFRTGGRDWMVHLMTD